MILASKVVLLMPIFISFLYYTLFKNTIYRIYNNFLKILLVTSGLLISLDILFYDNEILVFLPSLLFLRTIGNAGVLNFWYYDFFSTHDYTYFSHLNIINYLFNGYKFGNEGLGKIVGSYYWGASMNANANFWATDGIASLGIFGVLLISIFFSFFLILLNALTELRKNNLHILVLIPFLISLTNTSLFSSFLTGGLFLVILLFVFLQTPN